jgi:hypothetical protein
MSRRKNFPDTKEEKGVQVEHQDNIAKQNQMHK